MHIPANERAAPMGRARLYPQLRARTLFIRALCVGPDRGWPARSSASPPLALQHKISPGAILSFILAASPARTYATLGPRGSLPSVRVAQHLHPPCPLQLCAAAAGPRLIQLRPSDPAAMAQALRSASVASSFCGASEFVGSVERLGAQNGARVVARFASGTKKVKQAAKTVQKKFSGGGADRPLWFPGAKAPEWLDGSLPGDYGFDPLSLGKSPEYLQIELDSLNQNLAKNEAGDVIGSRVSKKAEINPTPFQPYSEVFGLQRFRECELIHGRWAMLAILGALSVEALTGVTWQDAGKVELVDGASYFGLPLPFSITSLVYIEALLVGGIEFYRNSELDPEKRLYPGGKFFDPLKLADDPEKKEVLKLAEIKHARLAMVAALGFAVQAAATGKGPLDNWATHLADPLHTTIFDTFSK